MHPLAQDEEEASAVCLCLLLPATQLFQVQAVLCMVAAQGGTEMPGPHRQFSLPSSPGLQLLVHSVAAVCIVGGSVPQEMLVIVHQVICWQLEL